MSEVRPLPQPGSTEYWAEVNHLVDDELLPKATSAKLGELAVRMISWQGVNELPILLFGYNAKVRKFRRPQPAVGLSMGKPSDLAPGHIEATAFTAHLSQRQLSVTNLLLTQTLEGNTFEEASGLMKDADLRPTSFFASVEEYNIFLSALREGARQRS